MVAFGLALALSSRSLGRIGDFQIVRRAAEFSYSLYVIHLPCCVFVAAIYERWFHWPPALVQPDLRGIAGFAGLVVVAVGAAWLFSLLTEKHTTRARRWLRRVLLSHHA
jgi:peptidoglycan/LPS O-acetylase OafA/YrhL